MTTELEMRYGRIPIRSISYRFTLKRTCTSCIVNNLVPVSILTILNLLSYFVPTDHGAKLMFSMPVFLTLAVFLTIIMESLPESVDGVSYLCAFVTFQLGVSATTLLLTVMAILIHGMGDTKIPPYAKLMVKTFGRCRTINDREKQFTEIALNNNANLRREMMSGKTDLNENGVAIIDGINNGVERNQSLDIKWENVSDAFNMMMFLIVLVTQIIATTLFVSVLMI